MSKQTLPVYSICSLSAEPVSRNELIADRFDHYLDTHQDLHFPHRHSFYHLVYFTKGSGGHSIDFEQFAVEGGQIYLMIPGQVHTWNFKQKPDGFIINFSDQYLQGLVADPRYLEQFPFFSGMAREQVIVVPVKERDQLVRTFETILEEHERDGRWKDDMIRAALVQLFIQVSRFAVKKESASPHSSLLLRNFQQLIDRHYKEKKLTKDYAALLYVTPNHLNALSKHLTGRPAGELIRDRVLLEAKRLLVNTEIPIAAVAEELEFADNSYFSKFFKKYAGMTPETFRNKIVKL